MNASKSNLFSFLLGGISGISLMFICGLLYLRHHLAIRYDFPDVTMQEMDVAFDSLKVNTTGWTLSQDVCTLPVSSSGRAVHNWKACKQQYARMLLDSECGMTASAFLPCTFSVTHAEDGHAVVSRVNTRLLGFLLGTDAKNIFMNQIDPEQNALICVLADHAHTNKRGDVK